jgi:DNA-binding SARP family transcriptional activator
MNYAPLSGWSCILGGGKRVIYGLLGELEVRQEGQLLELPGGPTLRLLAGLLINANRRMPKTDLIRVAWGTDEVKEAQLHKRVSAVREVLTKVGRRDDIRTHSGFGYELRVAEDDVDTLLFQRMIRQADEAVAEGNVEDELTCLRRALGLWRGPHPLSNVHSDALRQDIVGLEQRHKRAAVRLFGLELDQGNHEGILDELELMAAYYPADQRLCEQLMAARYRCGHLTDAAAAYDRYVEALDAETAAPPDPFLRAFHFAIARGDRIAIADAEAALARRNRRSARHAVTVPGSCLARWTSSAVTTRWSRQRDCCMKAPVPPAPCW